MLLLNIFKQDIGLYNMHKSFLSFISELPKYKQFCARYTWLVFARYFTSILQAEYV